MLIIGTDFRFEVPGQSSVGECGVWGQNPQRGPGAEPLVRGGEAPLKLKAFWLLDVQRSRQIYPFSQI